MASRLTATEAARNFADVVNRVRYRGESFVVERNGEDVCRIEPVQAQRVVTVADMIDFLASAPRPDDRFAADVEEIRSHPAVLPQDPWPA